jgi:3-oxoacyl-[acyl-carrier protein] reductase
VDDAVTDGGADLEGRTILVTGGGAGIGRAVCIGSAEAGANVVVAAPGVNGDETAAMIHRTGASAVWVRTDVTVAADVEAAVDAARSNFGGLDALVHNATSRRSSEARPLDQITDDEWEDHVAVSLRGAFHCARFGLPALSEREGTLVLMTSPAAMEGSLTLPAYAAVKGALRGLTKSLAVEWGPLGVRVVAVSPLATTPALIKAYQENAALEPRLRRVVPIGRVGDPEQDIAPVIRFLVGEHARYITGQTIVVDGGRFTTL